MPQKNSMETVTVSQAKAKLHDITDVVRSGKGSVTITRYGKRAAVLVTVEDYKLLEKLIERFEDEEDVKDARQALADPNEKTYSLAEVEKELGL